ncbi:MAG: putative nucleotide-diphospho-sugar transferase [Chlamydiota bacterium]
MKGFPLIVSYYTKDTLYQLEVQNLIASCEMWGLEHHVEAIDSLGSWERNCAYKPLFLYQKLEQFQRPLFWLDADAVFLQKPQLLDQFSSDIATRINASYEANHPSRVITGSLYVNNTEPAKRVLKVWAKGCIESLTDPKRTDEMWDQVVLRDVFLRQDHGARIEALPLGYAMIVGHPLDEEQAGERVIGHYQASRRFKKMINGVE